MDKKQLIITIFVLVISSVFVIQMFAVGALSNRNKNSHTNDNQVYPVQLTINSKLASYGSYLSVEGNYEELKDILMNDNKTSGLISSMIDISKNNSNKTLIYLKDSLYTKQISDILSSYGYKMYSDVNIQFPDNISVQGTIIDLSGESIKIKAPPVYDIGDDVKVELSGYVQNNKLIYIDSNSVSIEPVTRVVNISMNIKKINKIEFNGNDEKGIKERLDEITHSSGYSFEQLDKDTEINETDNGTKKMVLKLNITNATIINNIVNYLDDIKRNEKINNITSYVQLYSHAQTSQGIYDPITFNYPLPGLHHVNDSINTTITLSLDWGKIIDIKKATVNKNQ
ncbi:hypothetical protein J7J26_02640 [Candidatus Micrarchaeota archaeon]|nr:hypothetical protein [Candidatus Micrarchaeota archaeon]